MSTVTIKVKKNSFVYGLNTKDIKEAFENLDKEIQRKQTQRKQTQRKQTQRKQTQRKQKEPMEKQILKKLENLKKKRAKLQEQLYSMDDEIFDLEKKYLDF